MKGLSYLAVLFGLLVSQEVIGLEASSEVQMSISVEQNQEVADQTQSTPSENSGGCKCKRNKEKAISSDSDITPVSLS
jgi:hypothetical protein